MGKVRTRVLGSEEEEKKQKEVQKKRSAEKKAVKAEETEDVKEVAEAKVEVKAEKKTEEKEEKSKKPKKKSSGQTRVRGKKYMAAAKNIDRTKFYTVTEAVSLLKKLKFAGFDESVELHLNVEKDGLKGEVELPHATGKTTRVVVVSDELLSEIEGGKINFDMLVTHPSFMPKLAKYAKVLGPRGLMPNPKAGTISPNPEELVKKFSKGTLRWKSEPKFPLVHQMVGKISLEEKQIVENINAFINTVGRKNILEGFVKTTMSPSIKLKLEEI
jgi:large subunit ribosomal protein L1